MTEPIIVKRLPEKDHTGIYGWTILVYQIQWKGCILGEVSIFKHAQKNFEESLAENVILEKE